MTRRHDTWATKDVPIGVEAFYSGAWHDITADLSEAGWTVKRDNQASELALTLDNSGGDYSPDNPASSAYGLLGPGTPIRTWVEAGCVRLVLPAELGAGATTPDSADLSLATDVELTIDADLVSWRGSGNLLGKWTTGTDKSYVLYMTSGYLQLGFTPDGSTLYGVTATALVPIETGRLTVRGYLDQDDGSGNRAYTFSYSTGGVDGTFVQLGSVIAGGAATTIYNGAGPLVVGDDPGYDGRIKGTVYAATVRGTAGGALVASPDFTAQTSGATTFDDDQGNTWTVQSPATLTDRRYRFAGEAASWTLKHGPRGPASATTDLVAGGPRRRLGQGKAALRSAYTRAHTSANPAVASLVAYWPMEDGAGATRFGSGLPAGLPQTFEGAPELASDADTFLCSAPLPVTTAATTTHGPVRNYADTGQVQIRWLMKIPTGAVGATTAILQCAVDGSAAIWRVSVTTGGSLVIEAFTATGSSLLSHTEAFAVLDRALRYHFSIEDDGAGGIDWAYSIYEPGGSAIAYQVGNLAGQTIGVCTYAGLVPYTGVTGAVMGHLSVQAAATGNGSELLAPFDAYDGELASSRALRLAGEQGETTQLIGGQDTQALGSQRTLPLLDLLDAAAEADTGVVLDSRDEVGVSYRSGSAMRTQYPRLQLTWSENLLQPFVPQPDNSATRNKVTITRNRGAEATSEVTVGPLSTQPWPDGVGLADEARTLDLASDSQPRQLAGWATHVGTTEQARWRQIGADLAHPTLLADLDATGDLLDADIGDRLLITAPPTWLSVDDVDQLVVAYTEQVTPTSFKIIYECAPAAPHRVGVWGHEEFRYAGTGTVLAEDLDTTETGVDVTAPDGVEWGHDDGDYYLVCGGELLLVTGIAGAAPDYTFTVERSANRVVATHSTGDAIDLAYPSYWGI